MARVGWLFLFISHVGILALENEIESTEADVESARRLSARYAPTEGDCFGPCFKQTGFCEWCGHNNACCNKDANALTDNVPAACRGDRQFSTLQPQYQCVVASYKPGQVPPFADSSSITPITEAQCTDYMSTDGCDWTHEYSCPNQAVGIRGLASNDGSIGYRCCCGLDLWKGLNTRQRSDRQDRLVCKKYMQETGCGWTDNYNCPGQAPAGKIGLAHFDNSDGFFCCCQKGLWNGGAWTLATDRSKEGYNSQEFGLSVGGNGFGGQATTTLRQVNVVGGSTDANGNGFGISIGGQTHENIRGHDDAFEQNRDEDREFMDNHGGGNAQRHTVYWNPTAHLKGKNIGPITNHLSNAKGPCVFGICTDLDPDSVPGTKSFRTTLKFPTVVGTNRITVREAHKFKDDNIKRLKVGEDSPVEEACIVTNIEAEEITCQDKLQNAHLAGDSVFGIVFEDTPEARRYRKYDVIVTGQCDKPIKTLEGCSEAAARLYYLGQEAFKDQWAEDDNQMSSSSDPPYCYFEDGNLRFNANGGNRGTCSKFDMCLCHVEDSGYASNTEYISVETGRCDIPITTKEECNAALVQMVYQLGLNPSTTVVDDYQAASSTDPPWCYYEEGKLNFNSNGGNTGSCSLHDRCFCKKMKPGELSQATPTSNPYLKTPAPPQGAGLPPVLPATPAPTLPPVVPATPAPAPPPVVPATPAPAPPPAATAAPATAPPAPLMNSAGAVPQSTLAKDAVKGESKIEVVDMSSFKVGDNVIIGTESKKIIGSREYLVLDTPLETSYPAGTGVRVGALPPMQFRKADDNGTPQYVYYLAILGGVCFLICCIGAVLLMGNAFGNTKRKRATDRELDLKDKMIGEAEMQPMIPAEARDGGESFPMTQPMQPMTQSNIMTAGIETLPPIPPLQAPAAPVAPLAGSVKIPQNTVYAAPSAMMTSQMPQTTMYAVQPQLGMTTSLSGLPAGSSMYTGSMYAPYK